MPLIDARRLRRPRLLVLLLLALLGLIAVTHRRSENWTETEISIASQIEEAEYRHSSLGWCDVAPDLCAEFGEIELRKVMNYEGHGLARFLAKARQGQGFTVGALGGSVSIGHGLKRGMRYEQSAYSELNMHRIVFDYLDKLFPAKNGRQIGGDNTKRGANRFVNGAVPAIGSDYFAMCFGHHIPEDVDLVLVDMAINDGFSEKGAESYETLLRHLLALPNRPAVINLQVFALMFQTIATGGDIHQGISSYYDVPTVSLRNLLLPIILQNSSYGISYFDHPPGTTELDREGLGTRHISAKGHGLIGRLTNAFIDMRIRDLVTGLYGAELESRLVPETPRIRALQRFNTYEAIPAIPPKMLVGALTLAYSDPFHKQRMVCVVHVSSAGSWLTHKCRRELISGDKKYLIADQPGSIVSFDFVTAGGLVQLSVYRSHNAGLGTAACWVDDMKDKRVIIEARWDDLVSIGYTVTIANDLEDGDHVLTCDLLEETKDPQKKHEFRIIAVISS